MTAQPEPSVWARTKDFAKRKRPGLMVTVALGTATSKAACLAALVMGAGSAVDPTLGTYGAGAVLAGALGKNLWAAYAAGGGDKLRATRELRQEYGNDPLQPSGQNAQAESEGYDATTRRSHEEGAYYRAGVCAALRGAAKEDKSGWPQAKREGHIKALSIIAHEDKERAEAYERGCGRALDESGQAHGSRPPSTFALTSSGASAGGGVSRLAGLRLVLAALGHQAGAQRADLARARDTLTDVRDAYQDALEDSVSGRDVLEAFDVAVLGVEEAGSHLLGAEARLQAYVDLLNA